MKKMASADIINGQVDILDPLPPAKIRVDLNKPIDVRREMASVYRDVKAGKLPSSEGTRRIYMLQAIGKAMIDDLDRQPKKAELPIPVINVHFSDEIEESS